MLYYEGFVFNIIKSQYKPKKNNVIYRCSNYRKDELNRIGNGRFCNVKIKLVIDSKYNINNQKFDLVSEHSNECYKLVKVNHESLNAINEYEEYETYCINYLDNIKGELNMKKAKPQKN